jgi:TolB-like protein/class 3 adenylate cyclase/tetratricopeptide (TPR) repeat protein
VLPFGRRAPRGDGLEAPGSIPGHCSAKLSYCLMLISHEPAWPNITCMEQALKGERVERRLTAILMADVVGYSRLIGADDERTLALLNAHHNALVNPKIKEHRGRIVRTTGDGLLVLFASVVDALRCGVEIQRGMVERNAGVSPEARIEFRMGINVGDIIIDGDSIHGDGVNVAARLEALAEPSGICVSGRVQEDVHGRLDVAFKDIGEQQLKNIARPVRVYRVRLNTTSPEPGPVLPDKPSIAVMPFSNISGDPDQEYFADGIVEEIITALSHTRWLFVIARNSSFTYKGRPVDVKQASRELGVRYVLEGSVRKAANRVRITAQLIDGLNGAHLWAERFDGTLDDIFDLQDQVTASVVGAIAPKMQQAEIERAKRKPTGSLDAYDYYLRGLASLHRATKEAISEALGPFYKAIELDPDFSSAHGMAAWCYMRRKASRWTVDLKKETSEAGRLARRAVELGKEDAVALSTGGYALAYVVGDLDEGAAFINRALALNPNLALAWFCSGCVKIFLGEPELAIKDFAHSMRQSPLDPFINMAQSGIGLAHFIAGRHEDGMSWAQKALQESPNYHPALRVLAASSALAGRLDDAQKAIARLRELDPDFHVSDLRDLTPLRRPEHFARYVEGLRKAGLPE